MSSLCLTMRRPTYLIAFLLLCIQQECICAPLDDGIQWVYSYLGYVDTRSSACDERIARMTISANLTMERYDHYIICQLSNIKTSLFNGPKKDINLSHEEDIPKEAEVLKLPFMFTRGLDIAVAPHDPMWSVNLKRGIASNFDKFTKEDAFQKTVFGDCKTSYDLKDKNRIIKTINHTSCKDTPDKHDSNVRSAPAPEDFETIHRETVIEYKPDVDNENLMRSIHSVSKLSYQPMPKSPNTQHIDQHLQLDLLSYASEFTDRINIDQASKHISLIFEYDEEWSNGRHIYDTKEGLTKEFFQYYDKFEKHIEAKPIPNRVNDTDEPMEHIFYSIAEQPTVDDILELHDKIQNKANWQMYSTFISILPYIGNRNSVKFINDLVVKGDIETAPFLAVKLLATFPDYISKPTTELVEGLEALLNVGNVTNDIIKNSQILSFASVIARAIEQDTISDETLDKYIKLYHDTYLKSDVYEEKMVYLLGLINMGQGLKNQFIMDIITDSSQSANLRSLAIAGFKNRLLRSNPLRIFKVFWPMVQDKKENFDLRAQALDYILTSGVGDEEFKIVLDVYKNYQADDIHGKHLANYFLSYIESYQNNSGYDTQIEDFATEVLETQHFPIFSREWLTGNYRLAYRDSDLNMGGFFETKLIANPVLNTISTVQFVTRRYAFSLMTQEVKVYLKLHGAIEFLYKNEFFKRVSEETTVPELLAIIKEFDFKMKKRAQDFHIEIVVFVHDKAVFATAINSENRETLESKWKQIVNVFDGIAENTFSVSFPVRDYRNFPSVLGTPININTEMQQVTGYGFPKNDLTYRSSWSFETRLYAYNPLVDTSIMSYKYYGDEIGVRTRASINLQNLAVVWAVKKDSFSRVWDHLIGTSVQHEHILKKYCADCDAAHEIPTNLLTNNRINDFSDWGMSLNRTLETNDEEYYRTPNTKIFNEFMSTHHSNANAFPFAKPFLFFLHYMQYKNIFENELQRGSAHSIPIDEDGVQTLVHLDFAIKPFVNTVSPFHDMHNNFSINVFNKNLDDEDINSWHLLFEFKSTHNHKDEHGNDKVMMNQNLYYHRYEANENDTGINICSSREELLPAVRSDRFSLVPIEETTATTIIRQDYTPSNYSEITCSDNSTVTLTETFIVSDAINKKVKESADYKECQKESVGLKFVPPTRACIASFLATTQYSQHKINAELKNMTDFDGSDLDTNHLFEATLVDNNKMKFELLTSPFRRQSSDKAEKYFKYTTYYPYHTKNPVAQVYREYSIFKRSCIVTPKKIRSFTGHNIPIDGSKQVAFVECFEGTKRGMTVEKVSDTHVGFRLWSRDNIIDATVQGDKIKLALNGNDLHESHVSEDQRFSVEFLDTNVVLIADDKIYVYYNTEYIYINAHSMYNDMICGVCSEV